MNIKLDKMTEREIENWVDKGLRHKGISEPHKYLEHWLSVGRELGFATHDDSWGEFEKLFSIIVRRMVAAERRATKCETCEQEDFDMRAVW